MPLTFIPIETLLQMRENAQPFTLVDVLDAQQYADGHLPMAVSLPSDQVEKAAAVVLPDKNATIIVYCASYMCHASSEAALKLQSMGYTNVLNYKAGKKGWVSAGLPLAKGNS